MKRLLFLLLIGAAFGQNSRYDAPFPSISSSTPPYLIANVPPNSPVLAVCHSPANGVPCTNYATTYTSTGTPCANGAQDTPQPQPSACQSTGDAQGNIGFWAAGGQYDYTVCVGTACYGPFTVTLGTPSSFTGGITITGLDPFVELNGEEAGGLPAYINEDGGYLIFGTPTSSTFAIYLPTGAATNYGNFTIYGSNPFLSLNGQEAGGTQTDIAEAAGSITFGNASVDLFNMNTNTGVFSNPNSGGAVLGVEPSLSANGAQLVTANWVLGQGYVTSGGTVYAASSSITVDSSTTGFQNLHSYTFGAGVLNTLGATYRVTSGGDVAALNTTETVVFAIGGVASPEFHPVSSGGGLGSGSDFMASGTATCTVTNTGTSGQIYCINSLSLSQNASLAPGVVYVWQTMTTRDLTSTVAVGESVAFSTASTNNQWLSIPWTVERLK
jgi:hypothetical protein